MPGLAAGVRRVVLWASGLAALAAAQTASAHGDVHEQIAALSGQIRARPGDAALYLERGELHRAHQDYSQALADFERVAALDPALDAALLSRGRVLLEAGRPGASLVALERFLAGRPAHAEAHLLRARALRQLGRNDESAAAYGLALEQAREPRPDHYVERARVLLAVGRAEDALAGLEAGLVRIGPIVTLQELAMQAELELERVDAALVRLDGVLARSERKERWWARRGDVLRAAGRLHEAESAYASALSAIQALPARARSTRATQDLERAVRSRLSEMGEGR